MNMTGSITFAFIIFLVASISVSNAFKKAEDIDEELAEDETKTESCFEEEGFKLNNDNSLSFSPNELTRVLIDGSHAFSFNLLKALHKFESRESSPGILVSPLSIWSAMVITYMGAKGETEKELKSVLQMKSLPKLSIGMAYQGLRLWSDLKKNMSKVSEEKTSYSLANKIFYNDNLILSKCISDYFDLDLQQMDFVKKPRQSTKRINEWVKQTTKGKIVDLIPTGAITPWTNMIIANAVYFKSKWMNQFDKENTKKMPFYVSPTDEMSVDMMSQQGNFMYGISESLQATAIELPYANPDYSMVIILPEEKKGLDSLIRNIKPADLYELVSNMYDDEVKVFLPAFKMEQHFELAGPLYSMGIRQLFDPRYSDLSGFFDNATSTQQQQSVTVNSVVHKAHITVNEEGTEAAAATALLFGRSGRPLFPTQFMANRPFLYMIRDITSNMIVFLGTVRRPTQETEHETN